MEHLMLLLFVMTNLTFFLLGYLFRKVAHESENEIIIRIDNEKE